MPQARRRLLQGLVAVAMVVAGAWFGLAEVKQRFTHVHETDARVAGDLVTVSGRVAGRLVELAATSGDRVAGNQIIARIDARESGLLLEQLEAQLGAARAERERLAAERNLIDEQTRSRLQTAHSNHRAAQESVAALEPQLELARADLARAKSLYEKHVIAVQQIEQTRVAARRIEGEHRMAVAELEESAATMVLSGTIVNVAVPDVMGTFGVGQGMAQFLATAYLATMTASQLLGRWIIGLLGRRTEFHVDAMAATQNADNAAMREMLSNAADLLAPSGLPESTYDLVALDYLGQVIAAQASTIAYQDGFLLVTFVFVIALLPTGLIGWLDRRRRMA